MLKYLFLFCLPFLPNNGSRLSIKSTVFIVLAVFVVGSVDLSFSPVKQISIEFLLFSFLSLVFYQIIDLKIHLFTIFKYW